MEKKENKMQSKLTSKFMQMIQKRQKEAGKFGKSKSGGLAASL
jgi:hypothetical protein